ncbi:hypothetical protein ECDEC1B_3500 [Escherichia coli DEC1B]|nr:hypothetical protein ECDEC1B_3500 [Escherichia coli DEC1B]
MLSGKHINDERHIDEALPCADVSKIQPPTAGQVVLPRTDGLRGRLRQRLSG